MLHLTTLGVFLVNQHFIIQAQSNYVGMASCNLHKGFFLPGNKGDLNIKYIPTVGLLHMELGSVHVLCDLGNLRLADMGDNLQLCFGIACNDSGSSRSLDAPQAAGVRHNDTLNVLNNVCADLNVHFFRKLSQSFPRQCSGISDGNGLCAAHCRNQFFPKNIHIGIIKHLFHVLYSFLCNLSCLTACSTYQRKRPRKWCISGAFEAFSIVKIAMDSYLLEN